ncbi:SDR family oxidoreductase [Sediminibacterium ginsengisoli]|uniref:NAD(P)-dependent dehydrogenase, short-chain alcohol dehydrogenase family n=1 Tax=Sediminibacterium ginsengisoli TaxID=413434 RepID=A0A1T4RK96_9BACT|nr:SDR family oxidoreductase [Sediminibacterium ginsengisoli]SKA16393.1 NAD(P)-dependent dehydrogenase, short-chain alcohol dehydrogenase family [Sediminibacterium ginsengisoli]
MQQKTAVISGANRGIGLEVARQLAALNYTVYLGSRNAEAGQKALSHFADTTQVYPVMLDLDNPSSFRALSALLNERHGHLDVLVNNAGVLLETDLTADSTSTIEPYILRRTMEVNFLGAVGLTNQLLPLLLKSDAPRIVNVSSNMGSLGMHAAGAPLPHTFAYNTSKTALNSYTIHLANAYKESGMKVNSAHPGWVKTDMGTQYAPLEVAEGALTIIRLATLPADGPTGRFFHMDEEIPW